MPFCPQCRSEYEAETERCPDCGLSLVEELADMEDQGEVGNFVLLHVFPNVVYAEMVRETLENRGIPCLVKADMLTSAYGSGGGGVATRVRIFVPENRRTESDDIMNQMLDHI